MADYSYNFGARFPEKGIMELHNFSDITTDLYPVVQKFLNACQDGDEETATLLLAKNPELKRCIITAETWNLFDEERRNTQIYARQKAQIIDTGADEPADPTGEYVWIGGTV